MTVVNKTLALPTLSALYDSSHTSSFYLIRWKKAEQQRTDAFKLVLEKTPESPLNYKEIKPVHPKGNQPWMLIGSYDAEAETPILWPPDVKSWLIGKDPDAGKDYGQEEKGATEDEMIGWL